MKKNIFLKFCGLFILALFLNSCEQKVELVKIKTSYGDMLIYLYDATPKHKANFLKLTKAKFFDGTTFHRVIQNFVIQGGDPNSKDNDPANDGMGSPGYMVDGEFNPAIKYIYGALGAARDNNPAKKSNGSQFYIVVDKGGLASLDNDYTVFGQVVAGMDVAEKIAAVATDGANNRPIQNVAMSVELVKITPAEIKKKYGSAMTTPQAR